VIGARHYIAPELEDGRVSGFSPTSDCYLSEKCSITFLAVARCAASVTRMMYMTAYTSS